jgi:hypothetical protein
MGGFPGWPELSATSSEALSQTRIFMDSAAGKAAMMKKCVPLLPDGDAGERKRQEKALDEALMNTFPASDPVSIEQPKSLRGPEEGKAKRDEH